MYRDISSLSKIKHMLRYKTIEI